MEELKQFIETHVKVLEPLYKKLCLAMWEAETTGKKEAYEEYEKLEVEIKKLYSSKEHYGFLKSIDADNIKDPLLKRQLVILIDTYKGNQLPHKLIEEITAIETRISQAFSIFRGKVDGKEVSMNQIKEVLQKSKDSEERKKYWEAQKSIGKEVEKDLKELVSLRNKAASSLGYKNYYAMSLDLSEIKEEWLIGLFDDLDDMTQEPFAKAKVEIDSALKKRYKVKDIMPWHYEDAFFQECPNIFKVNFNKVFEGCNVEKTSREYYRKVGLKVDAMLDKSDLYERKGKNQHAFCLDLDKSGDTRILANLKDDAENMSTILHECGHAAYDHYTDFSLPFILRGPTHIFTTEAVAMLFGRLPHNGNWIKEAVGKDGLNESGEKQLKFLQLVLSRWIQVMVRFEREMYSSPDQDLNRLWWDLVEKYQEVRMPEGRNMPDYASKNHICTSPVYYHNYQLGELFASQLQHCIGKGKLEKGSMEVGKFLGEKVFKPAATIKWDELVKNSTGEELSPKYFAKEFV
ncbi:MAG: M2 family metallopeptidase [Candidatus Woesearchaeota archaeon]